MNKIFIFLLLSNLLIQYIICATQCKDVTDKGGSECSTFPVAEKSNKICIDNPDTTDKDHPCLEKYCEEITAKATDELCKKLKNDTFTCSVSGTGDAAKCVATKIYCEEITAKATDELCKKLKNDTFTCSVSGTGDAAKCVATKIYCEEITKDATDDICGQFSNDTDKCGKTESKCLPTKYCEKVEYTDNVKCENYPAKTTDKKCHKDGNACKEYTPADDKDGVNGLKISLIMLIILFLF